ncbi:MAG TPA: hypothetical protein VMI35_12965 [Puia sp.]|nr:hypothetical protein [Puia sp.]
MKHINNRSQLEQEKLRLRVQQLEMEHRLRKDWESVKASMQSGKWWKEAMHPGTDQKNGIGDWLLKGLHVAAISLTNKVLHTAEEKAERGIDHLMGQVTSMFHHKKEK